MTDSFGRLRISNPHTQAQFKHDQCPGPSVIDEATSGTADSVHNQLEGSMTLRVSADSSSIIRQSRCYVPYQPGKSLLIQLTGTLDAGKLLLGTPQTGFNDTNTTSLIGYFDESNGYFFKYQADGSGTGTLSIVERSISSGVVVDNEIPQSCWNLDTFDGDGESGFNLNPTMSNIYSVDLKWLGVGKVRVGLVFDDEIYYVHEFFHSNLKSTTYIGTATLPIRYELTSGDITDGGTMKQICSTVISEGGYSPLGVPWSIGMADHSTVVSALTAMIDETETPLIALRLKHAHRRATVKITGFNAIATAGANVLLRLRIYPGYSDETTGQTPITHSEAWESVHDNAYVEFDINAVNSGTETEMVTAGSRIVATNCFSNNVDSTLDTIERDLFLSCGIENSTANNTKRDVILLSAQKIGGVGTEKMHAGFIWTQMI